MATGCVYDYLREAHLEQYHPYFVKRELLQCDHLASIQMHDYASLGVVSMADRVRLFKLVNHIKALHSAGKLCSHRHSQGLETQPNSNFPVSQILPTDYASVQVRPQIPHKPPQHNLERKFSGAPMKAPKRETRYLADSIEFRPGTDSPMFKCKKRLSFTDSDCDDTLEDCTSSGPSNRLESNNTESNSQGQPYPEVSSTGDINGQCQDAQAQNIDTETGEENIELVNNLPLSNAIHFQQSTETYIDRLHAGSTEVNYQSDTNFHNAREDIVRSRWENILLGSEGDLNPNPSDAFGNNDRARVLSIQSATEYERQEHNLRVTSSVESAAVSTVSAMASASTSQTHPSQSTEAVREEHSRMTISNVRSAGSASQSTCTNAAQNNSQNANSKTLKQSKNGLAMDIIERSALRSKKGAFSTPKVTKKSHAYFPKNQNKLTPSKAPKVKTLVHTAGYDYGVPNSPSQNKSRQNVQENERIRVCIRKRPVNKKETQRQEIDVIKIEGENTVIVEENKVAMDLSNFIQEHVFKFDEVFHSSCNNQEVYEHTAKPLVSHLFKGKRSTCFAFGQTGSGKTYTLLGNSKVAGLYEHAGKDIFERFAGQGTKTSYSLHVSYFEIYCGHLHDLLNKRQRVQVRENGKKQVCIAGLMETKVTSPAHLKKVVEYGNHFRKIGTTGVNNSSSRSHAILQMELQSATGRRYGRLSFIDLAGSERAADSVNASRRTQIEGAGINQSLLALKECIRSLDQESVHTPYRQSKLTHILRDSFTGDSRTCMIANISPTQTACENTLNTLRYAHRVKDLYGNSHGANSSRRFTRSPSVNRRAAENIHENHGACQEHVPQAIQLGKAKAILFHPSNIQLSSTPKKDDSEQREKRSENLTSSIIQDTNESPIRGHHLKKPHNDEISLTDLQCSKLIEEGKTQGAYSHLKYTSNSSRSSLNSKYTAGNVESVVDEGRFHRTEEANKIIIDIQAHGKAPSPKSAWNDERPSTSQNAHSNEGALSMKSLDKAAEYLMTVSNKVRHGYETAFAPSSSEYEAQPNSNEASTECTKPSAAAMELNQPHFDDQISRGDILLRHGHVMSNFDDLLNRASAAVRSKSAESHPFVSEERSDNLEGANNDSHKETSHKSTDFLKSRSEPSLLMLHSENHKQSSRSSLHSAYSDINHSGVFCDKEPPIARPGRPLAQRSHSEEARASNTKKQVFVAPENQSILSREYAEYEAKLLARNNGSLTSITPREAVSDNNTTSQSQQSQSSKTALPSPADFLQSLAQMKQLPKHNMHKDDNSRSNQKDYQKNRETLSKLSQNFLTADSGGRPFQDMLGSPSNTRVSSVNDRLSDHSGITTVISSDMQENSHNKTDVNNCAEANSTTEQEGDSGLGASTGFKQIVCDGEMSETDTMADVPSIYDNKSGRSSRGDTSVKISRSQTSLEQRELRRSELQSTRPQDNERRHMTNPSFAGSQNHLLAAHEDQLSLITDLCKQEMNLLLKVKSGQLSFPTYVKCLQELLSSKADVLAGLNSKLEMHTH